ncbi:hypothetical protein HY635_04420 [Candidatus Uhrbacteria bacterium]|nr:hypothetical protein [Candidatus Uhrbacteria bacterium]
MSEREESLTERMVRERSWRVPEGKLNHRRVLCLGLDDLFRQFADPNTSSFAARGLVQGVVLAAGNHVRADDEEGRNLRQAIVAFLTDIGNADPDQHVEYDSEVIRTARTTLAKHVCPLITPWVQPTGYTPESFGTLVDLIQLYETTIPMWDCGVHHHVHLHVKELTGNHLKNVRDCLGRVHRELRRHLGKQCGCTSHGGHLTGDHLRRLNRLFVDLHWWDVLSQTRAVSAIPEIYAAAQRYRFEVPVVPLQFDWASIEEHRVGGLLGQRAFIEEHREAIQHDLWAIQITAGGGLVPATIESADGFRPLLLNLVATFVREMEIAHPGALSGDMPLPEDPACLHHDECVDEAVRKGQAERAAAEALSSVEELARK